MPLNFLSRKSLRVQVEVDAFLNSTPLDISAFCAVKRDQDKIQKILSDNKYTYFTTFLAVCDNNQELVFFKTLRGLDDTNSIPGMNSMQYMIANPFTPASNFHRAMRIRFLL